MSKLVTCTKCKEEKLRCEFYKKCDTNNGLGGPCKECQRIRYRNPTVRFRGMFTSMNYRFKNKPNYKDRKVDITWEEFQQFYPVYLKLHKEWVKLDYARKYAPSVDRIDNDKGYFVDNIQIIPLGVNVSKDSTGEDHSCAKLMGFQVETIRWLHKNYDFTQKQLSRMFGVKRSNMSSIILRKTWKHL